MSNSPLPTHVDEALRWLVHDYIDDAILGVTFEVHRALKTGLLEAELGDRTDENQYLQVNVEGLDVFGQAPIKKSHECVCPNCSRSLAASRFAPHLEKCMGMGRNSSRIASRRIQNTSREGQGGAGGTGGASDDDADDDWLLDRKKRKRDKNSPRRSRKLTAKAAAEGVSWSVISSSTDSEKRAVLNSICGVVSEHTRKMCTRSMKCPQHTTFQRRAIREQLLGTTEGPAAAEDDSVSSSTAPAQDEGQAEGEGAEEGSSTASAAATSAAQGSSGAASGASSWDHDLQNSSTTSPADSTSTVLSSHSTNSSNRSASLPPNGDSHSSNGSVITSSLGADAAADPAFQGHHFPAGSGSGSKSSSNSSKGHSSRNNSRSGHGEKKSSSSNSSSKKKSSKSSSHARAPDK